MLGDGEIVGRFLEAKLQVHPDVVSYLRERNDPALLERVISLVPRGTLVVNPAHIPDLSPVKDGERFLPEPELEVIAAVGDEGIDEDLPLRFGGHLCGLLQELRVDPGVAGERTDISLDQGDGGLDHTMHLHTNLSRTYIFSLICMNTTEK
jgi:hypothetical protein